MRILALLLAASLAGCEATGHVLTYGADGIPQKSPDPRDLIPANPDTTPPDMAGSRRITEQDCSKPVDLSQGNLRCK